MTRVEIETAVIELVSETMGCAEPVVITDKLIEDLGADSLEMVQLGVDLESRFDIEVSDQDGDAMKTVGDVADLVEKKLRS